MLIPPYDDLHGRLLHTLKTRWMQKEPIHLYKNRAIYRETVARSWLSSTTVEAKQQTLVGQSYSND